MQKGEPDEVQPRLTFYNAAALQGFAICAEDGQVDPIEARIKPTAPDNIVHGERLSGLEQWLTATRADHTRDALDACRREVTSLDSNQWAAFFEHALGQGHPKGRRDLARNG
jgi:hypothetical protein